MPEIPDKLASTLDALSMVPDRNERIQLLIDIAGKFQEVPPQVAARPFPEENRVPACESEAYVWAMQQPDRTLKLYFAVENPSGVSAKALAAILDKTLSGLPASDIAQVDASIVEKLFRQNISMGKGMGLMSMVEAVRALAKAAERG